MSWNSREHFYPKHISISLNLDDHIKFIAKIFRRCIFHNILKKLIAAVNVSNFENEQKMKFH